MGNYHPDVGARHLHQMHHLNYDGSISVTDVAHLIGLDGRPFDESGYTHRFQPDEPEWAMLAHVARVVADKHRAWLGVAPLTPETAPIALHPQGHPGLPPPAPVPDLAPPDPDALHAALVAATEAAR